ncbi:MAG: AAA family ATPase [Dehalococcoidia bacterium]
MSVHARPACLHIRNFRGIPELDVDLHAGTSTYVIGPNNAGKSTVLNAVALAFKGAAFRTFTPGSYDYFRDLDGNHSDTFSVAVSFSPEGGSLPAVQGVGSPDDVHGIQVLGRTEKYGRLVYRHVLIGVDGKPITISQRTPLKGDVKEQYKDHGLGYSRHYARPDEIREFLPKVWHLTPENLDRSLYHWRTGPLRRLAKLLSSRFFEEDWELEVEGGGTRAMPSALERVHGFLQDAVSKFPFWTQDLKPRLEETLGRYVGRQAHMELRPAVEALEDWLVDQLVLSFAVDSGGPVTPLENMGQGWQSLVRMAALDVLRQYPDQVKHSVVVLYEEPETYLHPHLARKLREVLDGLSAARWTIICSTHAPDLISFRSNQSILRLWRNGATVERGTLLAESVPEAAKFQELLDERGNHELLFAARVVLCEGKDDVLALRHYLSVSDADLDGRSVSVVDLGGAQTLPAYARLASDLGIPWCGLTDEDLQDDGNVKPATQKARTRLGELAGAHDLVPIWKVSLEGSLGISSGKATPEWQAGTLLPLSREEIKATYPAFADTCEEILEWVTAPLEDNS